MVCCRLCWPCCCGNEPKYCHSRRIMPSCLREASALKLTTRSLLHAVGTDRGARQKGVLCACALAVCAAAAAKGSTGCSSRRILARSRAECRRCGTHRGCGCIQSNEDHSATASQHVEVRGMWRDILTEQQPHQRLSRMFLIYPSKSMRAAQKRLLCRGRTTCQVVRKALQPVGPYSNKHWQ